MTKVSVIIPVYNTEKYLEKCLDSVCNQTLKDIEILCINDCSTDDSLRILKKYAAKDERIKVINFEENKGVSIARNTGINCATGEFIGFVDSDDFVDKDFYEKLYCKAQESKADVTKGNVYTVDLQTHEIILTDFYDINDNISKDTTYFLYGFTSAIYKRAFIQDSNIKFPEGIRYFEDPYFSIDVTLHTNNIQTINDVKYYYQRRVDSQVGKCKTLENTLEFVRSANIILNHINKFDISEKKYKIYFNFLLEQLLPWCWAIGLNDEANIVATQAIYDIANLAKYSVIDLMTYHFLNKKTEERKLLMKNLRRKIVNAK